MDYKERKNWLLESHRNSIADTCHNERKPHQDDFSAPRKVIFRARRKPHTPPPIRQLLSRTPNNFAFFTYFDPCFIITLQLSIGLHLIYLIYSQSSFF